MSELYGTYLATFDSNERVELRRDGTFKHVTGRHGQFVEEGSWGVTRNSSGTGVDFSRFFFSWPEDVPGAGGVSGWGTYAEVAPDGTVRIVIPGGHYYLKVKDFKD